jgi:hypothetical protein
LIPNRAALYTMGIFSNFVKNISEDERWNGRTQSGTSWSPEQLRQDLRLLVETVKIQDQTDGTPPICQERPALAESNVRGMQRSGSRST